MHHKTQDTISYAMFALVYVGTGIWQLASNTQTLDTPPFLL